MEKIKCNHSHIIVDTDGRPYCYWCGELITPFDKKGTYYPHKDINLINSLIK